MVDYWVIFFIIASGQGLFLSLLLFLKQRKQNLWLSLLITLFSLTLAHYVTFWLNMFREYPYLMGLSNTLPWLFGPTLYLYIKQTPQKGKQKQSWSKVFHFLPFLLHFLYMLPFYIASTPDKVRIIRQNKALNTYIDWSQVVAILIYSVLIGILVHRTKEQSKWLRYVSYLFIGFGLSHASYYVMYYGFHYVKIYDYYISVFMAITIYWVGYIGFIKPEALGHQFAKISGAIEGNDKPKYSNSGLNDHHAKYLLEKLQEVMQNEKLYLNPDLKMKEVADKMGISGHHLSQILNEQAQQNYADFINGYRIQDAKQKLRNPHLVNEKIIAIAYDVGFSYNFV